MKQLLQITLLVFFSQQILLSQELLFTNDNFGNEEILDQFDCLPEVFEIEIEVSGVPGVLGDEYMLYEVYLDWQYDDAFSGFISLVDPQGNAYLLADEQSGSFPSYDGSNNGDFFQPRFKSCSTGFTVDHDTNSDDAFNGNPFLGVFPIAPFNQTNGVDPNGTWKITGCYDPNLSGGFFRSYGAQLSFVNTVELACPYVTFQSETITPASACGANDGAIIFELATICNQGQFNLQVDDGIIETIAIGPGLFSLFEIPDIGPGELKIGLGNDGMICNEYFFNIPVQGDPAPEVFIDCPTDVDIAIGADCQASYMVPAPNYGDPCGNELAVEFFFTRPDGSTLGPEPWDFSVAGPFLNLDQLGTYEFQWIINDANGNPLNFCQFNINTSKDDPSSFGSILCNAGGESVPYCDLSLGLLPTEHQINISGLEVLNADYGLASIYIEAAFPVGPMIGEMTLIDPAGNFYGLVTTGDFPNYDGSNGELLTAYLRTCDVHPGVGDNIPYEPGLDYTPNFSLSSINNIGLDPNGTWILETCGSDAFSDWDILCWALNFEKSEPVLQNCPADQTVDLAGAASVDWSVVAPDAFDNCVISIESYTYTDALGNIFSDNFSSGQLLNVTSVSPGTETIVWTVEDNEGNQVSCMTTITVIGQVDPCLNDTEDPVIVNCPPNASYELENGTVTFDITEPDITDNCDIVLEELVVTFPDGEVLSYTDIESGVTYPWTSNSAGIVTFDWYIEDGAGNSDACTTTITILDEGGCTDTEAPQLSNCPIDFTLALDYDNTKSWSMRTPEASDDCGIASSTMKLSYADGSENEFDFTPGEPVDISYFKLDEGDDLLMEWTVTDFEDNSTSCSTTILMRDGSTSRFVTEITLIDDFIQGSTCNSGGTSLEIEVHGQDLLSEENALLSTFFDGNLRQGFNGDISLTSPWGMEILLAAGDQGSFPGFPGFENVPGTSLRATFRECGAIQATTSNDLSYDGGVNQVTPIEPLSAFNMTGQDPNGIWLMNFCDYTDEDDITILGASLNFGDICPSAHNFNLTDASDCLADGQIAIIDTFFGSCVVVYDVFYSIDNGDTWQTEMIFDNVAAGDYEVWAGYDVDGFIECTKSRFVTVGGTADTQAPTIDCPSDFQVEIEAGVANWEIIDPSFADDCEVASAQVTIELPDGSSEGPFDIESGNSFEYSSNVEGTATYTFVVTDVAGNITECIVAVEVVNLVSTIEISTLSELSIYPTLTSDVVNISAKLDEASSTSIEILDAKGKIISLQTTTRSDQINEQIDMSNLHAGVYFIQIIVDNESLTRRVMKI